ncbi:amidohydrolase [Pseudomonas sp. Fl4BN1]|uniref:amidohydrolase n=1 Tax=Pseudomonas sp. Fl4BN1 TaxID=2697651 RepID=UPI0013771F3C|nr:amidohydrolase [Pseudomonas sp. Fl4BN1]NBF10827.1 amidohydrolase family protein [Pseudomonas sp. Fl4BN1]
MRRPTLALLLTAMQIAGGSALAANSVPVADAIWFNGPIITIDERQPDAQAVAVKDGKILAVGDKQQVLKNQGPATRMLDLKGSTLLPGFIDPHGHVSMVGFQAASANLLPPPDGANNSIPKLQETLRNFEQQSPIPAQFGVLFGFGYDDSQLQEQRHPTKFDLDAVSQDVPIAIVHQSSHLGVLNGKALELAGINASTPNPEGGVIRRIEGSQEPNGVLEENAFFTALVKIFPKLTADQAVDMLSAGQKLYISYGYTTLQDGRSSPDQVRTAIKAAGDGKLLADIVSYPDILTKGTKELLVAPWYHPTNQPVVYNQHLRIGGVKLTLDGSPQGKTAWLSQPYFKPPQGQDASYAGYGVVKDEDVLAIYKEALANRWQILTHTNGDRAIDQLLTSMKAAEKAYPGVDVRPVMIHGQTLRKDQVAQLKQLKIFPSLFPMHTYYWGDWHRESVLGPQRAENISPTQWVLKEGLKFTTHHDAPVALPDSMRVLAATVNRTTRSGYVLGPEQRVTPLQALKAMTLWSAYQHFEEDRKGSITPGKLADFVVLSANPLTVAPATLNDIQVLKTVKEGQVIYERPAKVAQLPPSFGMHGDPSLPTPPGIQAVAQGDGDLGPALDVIYDKLAPAQP